MNPLNKVVVPVGVFTENCLRPVAAALPIVICTGTLAAVPPERIVADTPVPLNTIEVAPVKFVPLIVAFIVAPCAPDV